MNKEFESTANDIETSNVYVKGMISMLHLVKKIYFNESDGGWSEEEMEEIFGQHWNVGDIFNLGALTITEKFLAWDEKKNQISVGDEVEGCFGKWIVYKIQDEKAYGFDADGHFHSDNFRDLKKTGVHLKTVETMMREWGQMLFPEVYRGGK